MYDVKRLSLLQDLSMLGTLSAVAEVNGVTASAVSQQLKTLEDEAGVDLLVRDGRRVRLTSAGDLLVEHAAEVLAALERARGAVAALQDEVAGEVTVAAYPSILAPVGSRLAVAVRERHPGLTVRLAETDASRAMPAVIRREIDAALVLRYPDDGDAVVPGVRTRRLFDEQFVAIVPEALGGVVLHGGLGVLGRDRWIIGAPTLPCTRSILSACRTAGFSPDVQHEGIGYLAAIQLVGAGLGVAVVPELSAQVLPDGVVAVPCDVPRRQVALAYRDGAQGHPVTHALLDVAVEVGRRLRTRPLFAGAAG